MRTSNPLFPVLRTGLPMAFAGALFGLGLAGLLPLFVTPSPNRAVFTHEYYRAYAWLFELIPRFHELQTLSLVAVAMGPLLMILWTIDWTGLFPLWRSLRQGTPRRDIQPLRVLCGLALSGFAAGAVAEQTVGLPLRWIPRETLPYVAAMAAGVVAIAWLARGLRHYLLRWNFMLSALGALLGSVVAGAAGVSAVSAWALHHGFTSVGLNAMEDWVQVVTPVECCAMLVGGAATAGWLVGVVLAAFTPQGRALPIRVVLAVSLAAVGLQTASLAARYDWGTNLVQKLHLQPAAPASFTAVIMQEDAQASVSALGPDLTYYTPDNLEAVRIFLASQDHVTALTQAAHTVLVQAAANDWQPTRALDLMIEPARRGRDSLLENMIAIAVLQRSPATDANRVLVDRLADPARYVFPGGISCLHIANLYQRFGMLDRAATWTERARQKHAEEKDIAERAVRWGTPARASMRGRLLQHGQPAAGLRIKAQFFVSDPGPPQEASASSLAEAFRKDVAATARDIQAPSFPRKDFADFATLRNSCVIADTDADGRFSFSGLDVGTYLLAVRVPGRYTQVTTRHAPGAIVLDAAHPDVDLGDIEMDLH